MRRLLVLLRVVEPDFRVAGFLAADVVVFLAAVVVSLFAAEVVFLAAGLEAAFDVERLAAVLVVERFAADFFAGEDVVDFAVPNFDCVEDERFAAVPPEMLRPPTSSWATRSPSCSTWLRRFFSSSTTLTSWRALRTRWAPPVRSSTRDFFFFLSAMVARLYSRMPDTIHLRTHAPVAERVLLPGDPGRALRLAQSLTDAPKMLNHNRGLWGYTGMAADGEPLTIQSTGMGGPSAAIVVEELVQLGARRLIRVGTCGALDGDLAIGDLVRAERVVGADGTSRALGGVPAPDPVLTQALDARGVTAVTTDVFYEDDPLGHDADVVEMEAAAVLAVAGRRGVRAAVLLAVSDTLAGGRRRICDDHLHAVELRLGEVALAALSP